MTRRAKRTPWFPTHIKPVHVGRYEARFGGHEFVWRFWWNGKEWCTKRGGGPSSVFPWPGDQWRGLAEKP